MAEHFQVPLLSPSTEPLPAISKLPDSETHPTSVPNAIPSTRPVPETPPAYPPRPVENSAHQAYCPPETSQAGFEPPPKRQTSSFGDSASPVHYIRHPHKLIAYLIPFPKPDFHKASVLHKADAVDIPDRFLIYTPPPPPLIAPREGEKEGRMHKIQRKWQREVRTAKTSDAKVTSWKGIRGRATKGVDIGIGWTTTSSLDFLNRIPKESKDRSTSRTTSPAKTHAEEGYKEGDQINKMVGLEELILVYPNSLPGTEAEIREEFVNTVLRSKSKAQKDAIIATGLFPVAVVIDTLAVFIWPFGGLAEIDAVWAVCSIRGAKRARSVTKRLNSTTPDHSKPDGSKLNLTFTPSQRLEVLRQYLAAECHKRDPQLFKSEGLAPTEGKVLQALGWKPSLTGGETRNWEDEKWELQVVKEDLRLTMGKGGKEWAKWCKKFEKDPEKALKK